MIDASKRKSEGEQAEWPSNHPKRRCRLKLHKEPAFLHINTFQHQLAMHRQHLEYISNTLASMEWSPRSPEGHSSLGMWSGIANPESDPRALQHSREGIIDGLLFLVNALVELRQLTLDHPSLLSEVQSLRVAACGILDQAQLNLSCL
ncbi:hypothetical protein BASA50_011315 [Batrachochytrium salamandrivorans]|uniref:Uncharacterized protein n=1 Tax=Batrachochytrium salamandrivorans TaxID=1357716 RepID=A0ABQ8EW95_9FUNG|nr:hypothetical protein BASA60_007836 [Batrachochytrium salamandrivorans]KAH6573442.1 hypothetical protein BASA62_002969 [Batrachochytrium salamandrivorans]KAH6587711.1 hypothetical protein BASA50_011315 [Batrachochytrium salamandrivorans]KAH6602244.1 hypothetical protein BASA61_001302 [Batrachochytrium salamandrivorans]KAH9274342.1 hypothetical protein BASA83_003340 [Batrachochytrium salamandrivorans]